MRKHCGQAGTKGEVLLHPNAELLVALQATDLGAEVSCWPAPSAATWSSMMHASGPGQVRPMPPQEAGSLCLHHAALALPLPRQANSRAEEPLTQAELGVAFKLCPLSWPKVVAQGSRHRASSAVIAHSPQACLLVSSLLEWPSPSWSMSWHSAAMSSTSWSVLVRQLAASEQDIIM